MGRNGAWNSAGINFGPIAVHSLPRTIAIKPYQYCLQMILVYQSQVQTKMTFKLIELLLSSLYNECLNVNLLSINFNKTCYIQFPTNKPKTNININILIYIAYDNNQSTPTSNIKFLDTHTHTHTHTHTYISMIK